MFVVNVGLISKSSIIEIFNATFRKPSITSQAYEGEDLYMMEAIM